jgi:anti-sigma regulatory factor (Ser/Thr protein kinase)
MSAVSTITIGNNVPEIAKVLDLVEEFACRHGIGNRIAVAIAVAIDEVLSNTIRYGQPSAGRHRITVTLMVDEAAMVARIEDDGVPFDPSRPGPHRERTSHTGDGGYGLRLIAHLIDELTYSIGEASNVTELRKWLGALSRSTGRAAPPA